VGLEASSDDGGTIHVARGTYIGQLTLGSGNTGLTIVGAGATKTIIEAPSSSMLDVCDPNGPVSPCPSPATPNASTNPLFYVVSLTGASNVSLDGVTVSGANGIGSIPSAPCAFNQEYAGVYFDDSSGTLDNVTVSGIDMPEDQASCSGAARGVYVASGSAATSSVTMTKVSLLATSCLATTTVPLLANVVPGYSSQNLPVNKVPRKHGCKGWNSGPITVDGAEMQANAYGQHTLEVSGSVPYNLPAGSSVNIASPFLSPYGDTGILCENAGTYCSVAQSTVQGQGPSDVAGKSGIEIDGASATLSTNKVSGNSNSCGTTTPCPAGGAPGEGIELLNAGSVLANANTVTDNDVNIDGAQSPGGLLTDSNGRGPFTDGQTVNGASTLVSSSADFAPSDVGRPVTESCGPGVSPACGWNTFFDGAGTDGSTTFTSNSADFVQSDVNQPILDDNGVTPGVIYDSPPTTITAVRSPTTVTLSQPPNATYCNPSCADVGFYLPSRLGLSAGTFVSQFVSSDEVFLNQPALETATRTVNLGALPGAWTITGNTASDATALGASMGVSGFGDGIELDGTDRSTVAHPCVASTGYDPATIVLQGNTADQNAGTGIMLSGASCTVVGGTSTGQGNTATGNQIGLDLEALGPGGTSSVDNEVTGNTFTGDAFGVLASGPFAPEQYGGPIAPGSSGNTLSANIWKSNTLANVVDFADWTCSSCGATVESLGLAVPLVAGTSVSELKVDTAGPGGGDWPEGTVMQLSEGANPVVNVIVTSSLTPFDFNITPFTPTAYYDTGASVTANPFQVTNPTLGVNAWGPPNAANSCEPVGNGAVGFDSLTDNAGFYSC
jgi:hypothetical protein